MSTQQTPTNRQEPAYLERVKKFGQSLVAPHPSIQELGLARRAQLLNVITLSELIGFTLGLLLNPNSVAVFQFLLAISIVSYALGKWKYPEIGTLIFSVGFISIAYISLYLGTASGFITSVLALVPLALIVASALTGRITFVVLVLYATITTVLAPYYSVTPIRENDVIEASGIIFFTGLTLYGIIIFRANLEKARLDEIQAINMELQGIKTTLEERVEERTHSLGEANQQIQERAMRLQTVSEISREISSNLEQKPGELLSRLTRSISDKMGFYHVGIFLLDENGEYAVMRASNSQGGQKMLERHHQLKVGGAGIVGYVSQGGRPRIALDTGTDAVFFNNPDLPKTRSEIALPLKYGSSLIGVLDVQSTQPSAFKDEDVNILGTLANQIAIIIKNELNEENSGLGLSARRTGKSVIERKQRQTVYSYLPDGTISTVSAEKSQLVDKALASGETEIINQPSKGNPSTLAVPVKFRDHLVGIIQVQSAEENRKWTEDEIAMVQSIADRAAFALENARLFEETVRRAEQEETIAQITTQIGASTDFDRILQTTIQELGQVLGVSRSFIQVGTPPENETEEPAGIKG